MRIAPVILMFAYALASTQAFAGVAYADKSDQELTALTASLDELSQEQRRALLTELRARMASRAADRMIEIKTERRYGRIIRNADGSVVRIETHEQIVHYRPAPEADEQHAFGVGFEHRLAELEAATDRDDHGGDTDDGPRAGTNPKEPSPAPSTLPVIRANTGSP